MGHREDELPQRHGRALGRMYREAGRRSAAVAEYQKALALDAQNGAARRALDELASTDRR